MSFIFPNILIKNGIKLNPTTPHFGIDFMAFKLSKNKAKELEQLVKAYETPKLEQDQVIRKLKEKSRH